MAKKWRLAKDQTFLEGKSKTTNDLPFDEAKRIFNGMSKDTGAKRFRYKGDVYDLEGNKIKGDAPKTKTAAPTSSPKPKARPEASKKVEAGRLSFGDMKGTKEVPRSMGKEEDAPKAKTADGGAGLVAAGALTAAAIAARKGARTSTTPKITKTPAAPKGNTPNPSRRAALGLAVKKSATPAAAAPKATVTAPTETPKTDLGRRGVLGLSSKGGGIAGGGTLKPRLKRGGGGGKSVVDDPLNLMNKGGMAKKKKC